MARPSETACTRATFTEDVACLKTFNRHQRRALLIYFGALELAALGGEDYTEELGPGGTLATDSACNLTLDENQQNLAHLLIAQNNATDAGATVPSTKSDLAEAIACLQDQPPAMLDAMWLTVSCALGRHAAYPQSDL
jgi:hypothetical protein